MTDQQTKTVKLSDVMDAVKNFIAYLLQNIKWLLLLVLLTSGIATLYYFMQKPTYKGTVTFILEEKGSSGMGGLSGIASQFGLDLGGVGGGSGMFAGDNILDILKSRMIVEKVLLTKADTAKGGSSATMIDLYIDFSGLKSKWQKKSPELAAISFTNISETKPHTLLQDSVLNLVYDRIVRKQLSADRLNKKGSIIKITTASGSQVFSKIFTERLLAETKKLYIDVKTSTAAANVRRLELRADSLLAVLNNKSYKAAAEQLVDANSAYKSAAVPSEVSQRDKMVNYSIYTEVMKNLELSRIALANQTPAIQLLDYSRYPLDDARTPFFILLAIGIVAGFVTGFIAAFLFYPSASKTNE
jgi:hypothetical protein